MPRKDLIQLRRGTAAEWTAANPVLASGEEGAETDTGKRKIGNGTQAWNDLSYLFGGGTSSVTSVNGQTGIVVLNAGDIGLGNVNNTSDLNKPISTATQTALNAKQDTLISGTNIKTVNSDSLLGSGNLEVQGVLPNFPDAEILFGDGTNEPTTSSNLVFSDDKLGVGLPYSPLRILDVYGEGCSIYDSGGGGIYFTSDLVVWQNVTDENLFFQYGYSGGNETFTFGLGGAAIIFAETNAGVRRVGIDTITPQRKLDVVSNTEAQLRLSYTVSTTYTDF